METHSPARLLWTPVLAYMAFILALSSISRTPDLSSGSDKWLHAALYGGLAVLLVRALAGGWHRPVTMGVALRAVAIATAYGVTDEFHQFFVPLRVLDGLDLLADFAGAATAASVLAVWSRTIQGRRNRGV